MFARLPVDFYWPRVLGPPTHCLGCHLDARNQEYIGGEDCERRTDNSTGRGPAHGLGRPLGIQPRPAADQADQKSEYRGFERGRDHVG